MMNKEERILELLEKLSGDITDLKTDMSELKAGVSELKTRVSRLEADVSELKADVSELKTRVSRLEADVSGLKADVSGIKVRLDVEITRQLSLLAEGHTTLLETLVPKDRVEVLEDDVILMKSAIKTLSQRVSALEKVQ